MNWTSKFIGIPFKSHGRNYDGCDCYGLVRLALLEVKKILMESYASSYSDAYDQKNVEKAIQSKLKIVKEIQEDEIKPFDIILFKIKGVISHIGLVVDPKSKTFLHTLKGSNSHLAKFNSKIYEKRVSGFWRLNCEI